jgi:hypothetical protein
MASLLHEGASRVVAAAMALFLHRDFHRRRPLMAAITITDLSMTRDLPRRSMSLIHGAGAPWVFGWIQPFSPPVPSVGPVINLYQTNNTFFANQIVNQIQLVDVNNTGSNTNLSVVAGETGKNGLG